MCLFYLYATAKSEIQICSNKHETGLVYCTVRASIMPSLLSFLMVPWVSLQSVIMTFLGHTVSFFETIIHAVVDDNTVVLYKIGL